jgi:hypothetical protein
MSTPIWRIAGNWMKPSAKAPMGDALSVLANSIVIQPYIVIIRRDINDAASATPACA